MGIFKTAPSYATYTLAVELAMGFFLLIGMWLARRGRYKAHGFCQASVVVLNLALIACVMMPAFRKQVARSAIAGGLRDLYQAAAFAHGLLGITAEALALYVVLVATGLIPERLRFRDYKPWMRSTLALWWTTIALGTLLYSVWYAPAPAKAAASGAPGAAAGPATVSIVEFTFAPAELTVAAGTLVTWTGLDGKHGVEAEDGSFKADDKAVEAGRFEHRFDKPGTFAYFCEYHGDRGRKGMSGVIRVR